MSTISSQTHLTQTSASWLFFGLIGPLIPGAALALANVTVRAGFKYTPLVCLAIAAVGICCLLIRPSVTEGSRKSLKLGLDAIWNLWAFIGVGFLFVSLATTNGDTLKLEGQLKSVGPIWLSVIFATVCSTAAARISIAVAEWIVSHRPKPTATNV